MQHDVPVVSGPPLHVVGFNGTVTGGTLPVDGYVQIAFDRLLDPASVTRQSFSLRDDVGNVIEPQVTYDPVRRVVSLSGSGNWLTIGATYEVVLGVADAKDTTGLTGPKAIDGAVLQKAVVETFRAVADPGPKAPTIYRQTDVCNDVMPLFQNDCSSTNCHGTPPGDGTYPREGLALDSMIGLVNTAFGRLSQEANTGGLAGLGTSTGRQFGVQMPIIDTSGNPGNSWLLYKLLIAPQGPSLAPNPLSCGGTAKTPLPSPVSGATAANPDAPSVALSDSDRAILSELVLGNQMPYPPNPPLAIEELERIAAWIAQKPAPADCKNCPGP